MTNSYAPQSHFVKECIDKNIEREYPSFVNKIENHRTYIPFIIRSWSLNTSKKIICNKGKNSKRKTSPLE